MIRYGICTNTNDNCLKANSGEVIQVDGAREFVCSNCGNELFEVAKPSSHPKWLKPALVLGLLCLIFGLTWAFWPSSSPPLVLNADLNCQMGLITLTATGGNGEPILYDAEGLDSHSENNVFTIPVDQRSGKTFTFYAIQGGDTTSIPYTTTCAKPVPLTLNVNSDCEAKLITLTTIGGDKSSIIFIAEGLDSSGHNNVFVIPENRQAGSTLTFYAVQNGDTTNIQYKTDCPPPPPPPGGNNEPPIVHVKWTRVLGSEFCEPGTCILKYSEIDNLGHTRERRIENYEKCCPADK